MADNTHEYLVAIDGYSCKETSNLSVEANSFIMSDFPTFNATQDVDMTSEGAGSPAAVKHPHFSEVSICLQWVPSAADLFKPFCEGLNVASIKCYRIASAGSADPKAVATITLTNCVFSGWTCDYESTITLTFSFQKIEQSVDGRSDAGTSGSYTGTYDIAKEAYS